MKYDLTTGTWQDDTGCPIGIILVATSDVAPPPPPCRRRLPLARCWHHQPPWRWVPLPALPFPGSTVACPRPATTNCRRRRRHCHHRCRHRRRCCRISCPPPARLTLPPPPPLLLSCHPPTAQHVATLSPPHCCILPPPPSRSLRTIHCRLLHAASARTSPPPLLPQPSPCQQTKASILAKKTMAFATAMAPLLACGTLLGSAPPTPRRCRRAAIRRLSL